MSHPEYTVRNAAGMGAVAGVVFGLVAIAAAGLNGQPLLLPMRMAAGVLLGAAALASTPTLAVVVVGSAVHLALSAALGALYGGLIALTSHRMRASFGRESLVGLLFGLGVWAVGFLLVAPLFWPWFGESPMALVAALHAIAYGLLLAVLLAYRERHIEPPEDIAL